MKKNRPILIRGFSLFVALASLFIPSHAPADAYYNLLLGSSNQPYKLVFSSNSFSANTWSCVSVTVERLDRVGRPSSWSTSTIVNLSGTSSTFYSDSTCDTSISSVTIASGASTAGFYVLFSTNGSLGLTASSGTLVAGNQTETISLDPYTWVGGASCSPANWATGACWKGGAAPGTTNRAIFDGNCTTNCSASIAANIDVGAIALMSTYAGTVTQASGVTITVENSGSFPNNIYVAGGTFSGGNSTITDLGNFNLSGGTFTSTSASLIVALNTTISGGTFNHNSGTFEAGNGADSASSGLDTSNTHFYNIRFHKDSKDINMASAITAVNNLTLDVTCSLGYLGRLNGSWIPVHVQGSVVANSLCGGGDGDIDLNGSGSQTLAGGASVYYPTISINSTGTVNLTGTIILTIHWLYTSGTINAGTSTLVFGTANDWVYSDIVGGSATYNNVQFSKTNGYWIQLDNSDLNIAGTLTVNSSTQVINSAGSHYLNASGNVVFSSNGGATLPPESSSLAGTPRASRSTAAPFPAGRSS